MPNKPFNSKLRPHAELIFRLRRQRKTWQEIADALAGLKVKASAGNVCDFYKRYQARPNPMGWDDSPSLTEENTNGGSPVTSEIPSANARSKSPSAEQSNNKKTTTDANVPTAGSQTFKFGDPYAELADRLHSNG
jgi:hypothetical protein